MNNGNIDISLTLGTRADMSGIDQVRKGVDELSTAANGLPRELMSGGVGAVAPARSFSGSPSGGKMTLQVDGLDRLAGTIARTEGAASREMSDPGRTAAALEDMQAGIGRVAEMVEEVSCGASSGASTPPASAPTSAGNEWMMARLDQIASLLTRMDATLAKSMAATAKPEGPLDQMRKGMDDLSWAVKSAPVLSSGGVGGQTGAVPAYPAPDNGTSPKDWSVRIDGLDALGATVQGADKTVGKAADAVGRQSGWLQRSIEALTKFPGQVQTWAGGQMQNWRKFNGGLQNATNVLSLGKQAWDLGWKAGDALKDAFGLGTKKVSAQMADMLAKGKAKVEAWQAGLAAEMGRMNQAAALKKENALVKQINDAYDARKRTIEALDEKAARNLETQTKILAIENETSRSIIRQKQIRGEITESQARDALASIDAKDATERRAIERQQAENAVKTAEALAEAKAEQIRRMQELSASSPAAAGVNGLEPKDFYKQADTYKNAEATLKEWKELEARRAKLQKEVDGASAEMAKAAMVPGVGIALIAVLKQKKAQDEETLNSVMAEMDGMRKDYKMPEATNGQMAARLAAEKQKQQAALDKMMEGIKHTGLLGDVRGKDGTALYMAYAKALEMAQSVITNRTEALAALFKEQEALDDSVAVARNRLGNLMRVQRIEMQGEATRKKETDKTNAWQDNQQRDSTVTRTTAEGLSKAAEAKKKTLDANKKALDTAKETYEASLESFSNFAAKYADKDEKAKANADKFVNTLNRLKNKDRKNWDKQDKDDEKWVDKFLEVLKNKYGNDYNSERDKGMVKSAEQAWEKMNEILSRKQNVPKQEDEIRNLEEAARKASNLPEDIQQKNTAAMELTEWMRKFREEKVPRAGTLAENSDYEILYQVEDVVRKALQDGKVDKGERGQLREQLATLLQNNIGPAETPAIHEMVGIVREILGRYSSSQATARKLLAEVAELKNRLNKIDSQRGYGH